jgi:hypothetical protein
MIRISAAQMQEIQYIIQQSMNGFHVLFDNDTIKRFCKDTKCDDDIFDENKARTTERLVEMFMSTPTINGRKSFFESLNDEEKSLLIRTYFHIVENNIQHKRHSVN